MLTSTVHKTAQYSNEQQNLHGFFFFSYHNHCGFEVAHVPMFTFSFKVTNFTSVYLLLKTLSQATSWSYGGNMAHKLLDMFKQLGGSYGLPPSPENSSAVKYGGCRCLRHIGV